MLEDFWSTFMLYCAPESSFQKTFLSLENTEEVYLIAHSKYRGEEINMGLHMHTEKKPQKTKPETKPHHCTLN